jgi:hypothetical protein
LSQGDEDPNSFYRAFRSWEGKTHAEYTAADLVSESLKCAYSPRELSASRGDNTGILYADNFEIYISLSAFYGSSNPLKAAGLILLAHLFIHFVPAPASLDISSSTLASAVGGLSFFVENRSTR